MAKSRILIVDDTSDMLDILSEILNDYDTTTTGNGEEALTLAARDPKPDLILLDVLMPKMNGFEVCMRLKRDPVTKDIPVIFLSGLIEPEEKEKGLELGAIGFIGKPFNPGLIRQSIKDLLG